ncbi:hypothetical protein PPTG_22145 [Phytophthora nicotianae INRA-310]|uniref:Uncharacterized protein n=1 Tax=Phytophthora nicotianae (strain INRA-310) TaxID=761204 RepID=W2QQK2_PHYN3|nr:hypothetical protein PPTG_22145 [Phytophthora nicotianae INRA-310]ETN14540.1 hypothetical protein PPTG_22145 [Phytophthora nicotianae INRA-310]
MNAVALMVEGVLCSNAVSKFRKYDEGNRIILVGTTKWFLPSGELHLQYYNWTVVSPSPFSRLGACVMRHYYKLEMTKTLSKESGQTQKLMFDGLSDKMRCFYQAA